MTWRFCESPPNSSNKATPTRYSPCGQWRPHGKQLWGIPAPPNQCGTPPLPHPPTSSDQCPSPTSVSAETDSGAWTCAPSGSNEAALPSSPAGVVFPKKSAKKEALHEIQSLVPNMSTLQYKITCLTQNQENLNLNEKSQSTDTSNEMTQMLGQRLLKQLL